MTHPPRPTAVDEIQCDVCMREIPASEAVNAEADEYVMNFCGLECYDRWRKQGAHVPEHKKTETE